MKTDGIEVLLLIIVLLLLPFSCNQCNQCSARCSVGVKQTWEAMP